VAGVRNGRFFQRRDLNSPEKHNIKTMSDHYEVRFARVRGGDEEERALISRVIAEFDVLDLAFNTEKFMPLDVEAAVSPEGTASLMDLLAKNEGLWQHVYDAAKLCKIDINDPQELSEFRYTTFMRQAATYDMDQPMRAKLAHRRKESANALKANIYSSLYNEGYQVVLLDTTSDAIIASVFAWFEDSSVNMIGITTVLWVQLAGNCIGVPKGIAGRLLSAITDFAANNTKAKYCVYRPLSAMRVILENNGFEEDESSGYYFKSLIDPNNLDGDEGCSKPWQTANPPKGSPRQSADEAEWEDSSSDEEEDF
jgi:hypothetical protein